VTYDPPLPDSTADDEPSPATSVAVAPTAPTAKPHVQQKKPVRHGGRRHRWH
jgi:hypothetical protein